MAKSKKLSRFNHWVVGRGAALFLKGLTRQQVVDYFFRRYGTAWKINSRESMEQLLFVPQLGRRLNFSRLFEGKSPDEIRVNRQQFVETAARDAAAASKRMKRLMRKPKYRKAAGERIKRLWANDSFRAAKVEEARAGMQRLNRDPGFASANRQRMIDQNAQPAFREKSERGAGDVFRRLWKEEPFRKKKTAAAKKHMTKLWSDPKFVARHSARIRALMKTLWKDSTFRKKQIELITLGQEPHTGHVSQRTRALWKDPAWRQKQRELISLGLRNHWVVIRRGLLNEFTERGLMRTVEFTTDAKGKKTATNSLFTIATPDAKLQVAQRNQRVEAAVETLPGIEREAVSLVFFNGVDNERAAALMGISLEQLSKHLESAYGKMAPKLKGLL